MNASGEKLHCQVCLKIMDSLDVMGSTADGSPMPAYCNACFVGGNFTKQTQVSLEKMIGSVTTHMIEQEHMTPEDVKKITDQFGGLSFWVGRRIAKRTKGDTQ